MIGIKVKSFICLGTCFILYGLSIAFGVYTFVGTLQGLYLFHLGNAITISFMVRDHNSIVRYLFPVVSFAAYGIVRQFTQKLKYIAFAGSCNVVEQCIGAYLVRRWLTRSQLETSDSVRFIAVIFIVTLIISTIMSTIGTCGICLLRNTFAKWQTTLLTYFFSHVSGNYIGLYAAHVGRFIHGPSRHFLLNMTITWLLTAILHSFVAYDIFRLASVIATFPLLAYVAVQHDQSETLVTEVGMLIIVFTCVIYDRGPFVASLRKGENVLLLIVGLYTFVLFSSIMSGLLSVITQQRRRALLQVTSLKDNLLLMSSQVSHDVRAPLMHLLSICKGLHGSNTISFNDYEDVQVSCGSISDHMDSWLEFLQKVETGTILSNTLETCDMRDMFQHLRSYARRSCIRPSVSVSFDIERVPPFLQLPRRKLLQVVTNLLSNAIRYTEEGSVTVVAVFGEEMQILVIEVKDTGCGIAEEDVSTIFDKFVQGGETRKRNTSDATIGVSVETMHSYGVGLSIVKALVTEMKGTVSVTSVVASGSCFTVKVPALLPPENAVKSLAGINVLVVEDNVVMQDLIAQGLHECSKVDITDSGDRALQWILERGYDVVCLDDGLLENTMQGGELMQRLGELRNTDPSIAMLGIVDISGGANLRVSTGVVPCPKPFNTETLQRAVLSALQLYTLITASDGMR